MRRVHGQLAVAAGCQEWADEMRFAALTVPKQSPACPSISFLAINHGPSAEQMARVGGRGVTAQVSESSATPERLCPQSFLQHTINSLKVQSPC